jgi:antitoxin HigA-1
MRNGMRPIHPGEVLREAFLKPMNLSASELARRLDVVPGRISELVNEKRAVTAETALRLARAFDTTPHFWMNLQTAYDLRTVELESAKVIEKSVSRIDLSEYETPANFNGRPRRRARG